MTGQFLDIADNPCCLQNWPFLLFSNFVYPPLSGHMLEGRLGPLFSPRECVWIRVSQSRRLHSWALLGDCLGTYLGTWHGQTKLLRNFFHFKKRTQLTDISLLWISSSFCDVVTCQQPPKGHGRTTCPGRLAEKRHTWSRVTELPT